MILKKKEIIKIRLLINNKEVLVPYNEHFIKKIDSNKKTIEIELL